MAAVSLRKNRRKYKGISRIDMVVVLVAVIVFIKWCP